MKRHIENLAGFCARLLRCQADLHLTSDLPNPDQRVGNVNLWSKVEKKVNLTDRCNNIMPVRNIDTGRSEIWGGLGANQY